MKIYDYTQPLLSIHVPKCGGTSLINVLKQWYGRRLYLHYFDERRGKMPKKHALKSWFTGDYKQGVCIHGHFNRERSFGVVDYYPEINQAITFLRDPIEIALSVFHYNLRLEKEGHNYRDGKVLRVDHDIDEFLEGAHSYIPLFFPEDMRSENVDDYFDNYFVHVGVIEYYQESMDILAEKLGKPKIHVPHDNASQRTQKPSPSSVLKFKERHPFEYKLYEKALEINNV